MKMQSHPWDNSIIPRRRNWQWKYPGKPVAPPKPDSKTLAKLVSVLHKLEERYGSDDD